MRVNWERFGPQPEIDEASKSLIREIADHFILKGTGTPSGEKRTALAKDRRLLDELVQKGLMINVAMRYYPTFAALYYLPPNSRKSCEEAAEWVLKACQAFYRSRHGEVDELSPQTILEQANILASSSASPPVSVETVRIGMLFMRDFRNYFRHFENSPDTPTTALYVTENILDFENLEEAWEEELNRRRPAPAPAATTASENQIQEAPRSPGMGLADFSFVADQSLRQIIQRDYLELSKVRTVSGTKSRLILAGGLIEGLLLDALKSIEASALGAANAPKEKGPNVRPLGEWNLGQLLDVALELRVISPAAQRFGHGVRDYRNLIHPGLETRSLHKVASQEADIAETVLEIVIRELKERKNPKD